MLQKNNINKPGYILILALLMLSALAVLVTSLYNRVIFYKPYSNSLITLEKTKFLALSGIEIAINKLDKIFETEAVDPKDTASIPNAPKEPKEDKQDKRIDLIKFLNNWHNIKLDQLDKLDLPDSEIKLYITPEEGKINLAYIFEFLLRGDAIKSKESQAVAQQSMQPQQPALQSPSKEKEKPKIDPAKIFEELSKWGPEFYQEFTKYIENKSYIPNDVTELALFGSLSKFKNKWFIPPQNSDNISNPDNFFITDLFSLDTKSTNLAQGQIELNPLLLSLSIRNLLGFKNIKFDKDSEQMLKNLLQSLDSKSNWETNWDKGLDKLYGKAYKDIPENIRQLFVTKFEPSLFFVISDAKIGSITQRIYAIVERIPVDVPKPTDPKKIEAKVAQSKNKFIIKRIYWNG